MTLIETREWLNAVFEEHMREDQFDPAGRPMTHDDVATMGAVLGGTGVVGAEAAEYGAVLVMDILRGLDRMGLLRSADRSTLRAALFAAYFDGLAVGLHHSRPKGGGS